MYIIITLLWILVDNTRFLLRSCVCVYTARTHTHKKREKNTDGLTCTTTGIWRIARPQEQDVQEYYNNKTTVHNVNKRTIV